MSKRKNSIDHRERKNPRSAEVYKRQRLAANMKRVKQVWNEVIEEWIREGGTKEKTK